MASPSWSRVTAGHHRAAAAAYPDVHDLCDLPEIDEEPDEDADLHHEVGFVVQDVEEDNEGLEDAEEDGADREPLQRLPAVPELDVCRERRPELSLRRRGRGTPRAGRNPLRGWDAAGAGRGFSASPPRPGQSPTVALTVLESQELEDAVHDGDNDGQRQQVGVRLQESDLQRAPKPLSQAPPHPPGTPEDPGGSSRPQGTGAPRRTRGFVAPYRYTASQVPLRSVTWVPAHPSLFAWRR